MVGEEGRRGKKKRGRERRRETRTGMHA